MTTKHKAGPGGTQFIVRSDSPCDVVAAPAIQADSTAADALALRRAVEAFRPEVSRGDFAAEEALREAMRQRQLFWVETCRDPVGTKPVFKSAGALRRQYGWRMCTPTPEQVQFILDLLDAAFSDWDQRRPAYFFEKLETHFPHLQRYSPHIRV